MQLQAYRREVKDFTQRIEQTKVQNEVTLRALEATEAQERNRGEVISLLQQDRDNLQKDAEMISNLLQQRTSELETLRSQLETLRNELDRMKQKVGATMQPDVGQRVAGR